MGGEITNGRGLPERSALIESLKRDRTRWDILIIGGGATGLGSALDAASRGYRTLLIEQHDFAKGTSSRSTKLVHGGVRYLRQGNLSLVFGALRERGLLINNAPHVVRRQSFVIPGYRWWEKPFYGAGLKLYDALAAGYGFGPSRLLSREETLRELPTLEPANLRGGVRYFDGQFDDSRLAINIMQTIFELDGVAVNYLKAVNLIKANGTVRGVEVEDSESGERFPLHSRVVVNATGVFSDSIRRLDEPGREVMIQASQGVHIVLDRTFLPGKSALMIPGTDDGRVLFAVPWQNRVIVGTTDTPVERIDLEPTPAEKEIEFLLEHSAKYLVRDPVRSDVKSVFTGLRPLVRSKAIASTKKLSRDHTLLLDPSGLVTITGGKWTTYRKMAEETVDLAARAAGLESRRAVTGTLRIHGAHGHTGESANDEPNPYGSDSSKLDRLAESIGEEAGPLHPELPCRGVDVVWAVRNEMARTVEDVLSRRTRSLLLDAELSIGIAGRVASIMARELKHDAAWESKQIEAFRNLAAGYLCNKL